MGARVKIIIKTLWIVMALSASQILASENQPNNYDPKSQTFHNVEPDLGLNASFLDMASASYKILFDNKSRVPSVPLPEVRPDLAAFMAPNEAFQFIWFGHSTLLFKIDEIVVLVDPVFSSNASPTKFLTKRFQPSVLKLEEMPAVDAIIISHDHYDHLDAETITYFSQKGTKFIVPSKMGGLLEGWGVDRKDIVELNWGETFALGTLNFTATVAHHTSGRGIFDQRKTLWASWVLRGKSQSIFYSGDTAYKGHFKAIGEKYGPFDYAFIENGQYDVKWPDAHMQPEESVQAALDVKAKAFIPVHWGMFDLALHHWSEPVVRSSKIAYDRGLAFLSPKLGERVDTGHLQTFSPWWEEVLREEEGLKRKVK